MPTRRAPAKLPVRIRRARRSDLDALLELEQRVFATDRMSRPSLRRILASSTAAVAVAELDGRLAGSAVVLFRTATTVGRLYSIAVTPDLSGKGVGAVLLSAAERVARSRKCRCMRLEVHERNAVAIARYRKSGYQQFGRYDSYYEDGGDALRFEKPLGPSRSRK
jgi:[ribosomal protein S18]-alanine N-acetyltransferase